MKITAIHLYAIRLPLRNPFVISYGSYSDMPSIIVKMETDEGIIGYGEGVADDHVTGEFTVFQQRKPQLILLVLI